MIKPNISDINLTNWRKLSSCLLCCLAFFLSQQAFSQGIYTDFGQNRVQFHDFEWSYVDSPNFTTYFYQGGQDLGKFAMMIAEDNLDYIESKLEYKINGKIEILVYHNISDLRQTNIGQVLETPNSTVGGSFRVIGNKIFVSFNGNHRDLERQVRQGVAKVFIENMVFGGNIQEILQNAVLLNLPNWFMDGLVRYIGEEWSTEIDNQLREGMKEGRYDNFNKLNKEDAAFAGHAFWHYIAENYGPSTIPNLLYLTRINRSIESGFLFVLGGSVNTIILEWNEYYKQLYQYENAARDDFEEDQVFKKIKRKKRHLNGFSISPDARYITYTLNEKGRYKIYLYDLETNKKKVLLRNGFRSHTNPEDDVYPLVSWSRKSEKVAIVYEKRDEIYLLSYDLEKEEKEKVAIKKFTQVLGMTFTDDPRKLILSAVKNSQTDLFTYFIPNTKTVALTKDFYDDLSPSFLEQGSRRGFLFLSNRLDDTLRTEKLDSILPINSFDVFFYNLNGDSDQVVRLTNTVLDEELTPMQYDDEHFTFLSDGNGIINRYIGRFDSVLLRTDQIAYFKDSIITNPTSDLKEAKELGLLDSVVQKPIYQYTGQSFPVTNYQESLEGYQMALKGRKGIHVQHTKDDFKIFLEDLPANPKTQQKKLENTTYKNRLYNRYSGSNKIIDRNQNALENKGPTFSPFKPSTKSNTEKAEKKVKETEYLSDTVLEEVEKSITEETTKPLPASKDSIDIDDYFFQSEFEEPTSEKSKEKKREGADEEMTIQITPPSPNLSSRVRLMPRKSNIPNYAQINYAPEFKRSRIRPYKVKFSVDQVTSQLDNSVGFNQYESFAAGAMTYTQPDLSALISFSAIDLLEDYKLAGGFKMPLGLDGSEYLVSYSALRKRLDKKFIYHRKVYQKPRPIPNASDANTERDSRIISSFIQGTLSWPLDINRSIRAHAGYRSNRIHFPATDEESLYANSDQENSLNAKLEFIFDNAYEIALNIPYGTRYKIYAEFHKPFSATVNDREFKFDFNDTGWMGVVGADFRHYQKLHKQIIWANRLAFGKSFGPSKLLYYLGGMENSLTQLLGQDAATPINTEINYLFQTVAANMRGFRYNIRNGNNFALINSEVRIPIFSYFINGPVRSSFLRNFQIVPFSDIGTAWEGFSPFTEENRYFTVQIPDNNLTPVIAEVNYFKDPLVIGYGVGLRTSLMGFFLKVDVGWGIDSGARTPRQWYVTMGKDF